MKSFLRWVSKEYVYMFGYFLSILTIISGIFIFNGVFIFIGVLLLFGITQRACKDWSKILKRYYKINNKEKP